MRATQHLLPSERSAAAKAYRKEQEPKKGVSHANGIQEVRPVFDRGQDLHEKVTKYSAAILHRFLSLRLKTTHFVRLLAKHPGRERNG
jgi:hypothetical protein